MLQRITGAFLLCLMTLVMAVELPVLNFCACQKILYLSDCACEEVSCASADTCGGTCDQASQNPCQTGGDTEQCSVALELDLGDFSPVVPNDKVTSIEHSDFGNPGFEETFSLRGPEFSTLNCPSRGSPESSPPPTLALHKRHSVFLI